MQQSAGFKFTVIAKKYRYFRVIIFFEKIAIFRVKTVQK